LLDEEERGRKALNKITDLDPPDALNRDEFALLFMYTVEEAENSFYYQINNAMRDTTEITNYRDYIFYLTQALNKLPAFGEEVVYRAIDCKCSGYTVGNTVVWNAFSSSTRDPTKCSDFLKKKEGTIFSIFSKTGKDLTCSAFASEAEILFTGNSTFIVQSENSPTLKSLLKARLQIDLTNITVYELIEITE